MSVITCQRGNCENIMCIRYSYTYGNICNSCFSELERLQTSDIAAFMNSDVGSNVESNIDYDTEFELR